MAVSVTSEGSGPIAEYFRFLEVSATEAHGASVVVSQRNRGDWHPARGYEEVDFNFDCAVCGLIGGVTVKTWLTPVSSVVPNLSDYAKGIGTCRGSVDV